MAQSGALWDLGFKETSSVVDKGVVMPDLIQIMNGFSGVFLISALALISIKVRRDR